MDSGNNIKRRSQSQLLGQETIFKDNSPIISDDDETDQLPEYADEGYRHALRSKRGGRGGRGLRGSRRGTHRQSSFNRPRDAGEDSTPSRIKLRPTTHTNPGYMNDEEYPTISINGINEDVFMDSGIKDGESYEDGIEENDAGENNDDQNEDEKEPGDIEL